MREEEWPVLVAGGSLVGLTASVLLATHGVPHLLVERHRGTAIHPRAAAFHQRTMEVFRSIGLQQAVEAAAEREFVQNGAIMAVDTLGGKELAYFYRNVNDGVETISPTRRLFITQIGLEPVLRARASELGARHLYATELAGFEQDAEGVAAELRPRDGGEPFKVRARYMIAADGAHSPIRQRLGIAMRGRGEFADCITIYFRADVKPLLRDRNLSVVYVNQPGLLAFFRFVITGDGGFLAVFASDGRDPATLVRAALGVAADYPVEIEDVQPWKASADAAERFRDGRIFIAGDAAHVMPPTGGFGGNTGVADVHNLAWKLAKVLKGEAGEALLDSYGAERRPIAALTVEQAYRRYVDRVDPSLPKDNLPPVLDDPSIELGAVYRSNAVLGPAGDTEPLEDPFRPTGRPGTRIAHRMLEPGLSTLDLAATEFALAAAADAWIEAAASLGLKAHRIAEAESLGIGGDDAVLLRPDGVIGWRSNGIAADPRAALAEAMRRLTCQPRSAPA